MRTDPVMNTEALYRESNLAGIVLRHVLDGHMDSGSFLALAQEPENADIVLRTQSFLARVNGIISNFKGSDIPIQNAEPTSRLVASEKLLGDIELK